MTDPYNGRRKSHSLKYIKIMGLNRKKKNLKKSLNRRNQKLEYDEDTQALIDDAESARTEFRDAEFKFKEVEGEREKLKKLLDIDFGPAEEFGSLYEQCFDYTDREYVYTLCMFDKVTQKQKPDGSSINLGTWGHWSGSEDNKYNTMQYVSGLGCWNGPSRTAEIRLNCGSSNLITRVSEPERCKYLFDINTPAACTQPTKEPEPVLHEEL